MPEEIPDTDVDAAQLARLAAALGKSDYCRYLRCEEPAGVDGVDSRDVTRTIEHWCDAEYGFPRDAVTARRQLPVR